MAAKKMKLTHTVVQNKQQDGSFLDTENDKMCFVDLSSDSEQENGDSNWSEDSNGKFIYLSDKSCSNPGFDYPEPTESVGDDDAHVHSEDSKDFEEKFYNISLPESINRLIEIKKNSEKQTLQCDNNTEMSNTSCATNFLDNATSKFNYKSNTTKAETTDEKYCTVNSLASVRIDVECKTNSDCSSNVDKFCQTDFNEICTGQEEYNNFTEQQNKTEHNKADKSCGTDFNEECENTFDPNDDLVIDEPRSDKACATDFETTFEYSDFSNEREQNSNVSVKVDKACGTDFNDNINDDIDSDTNSFSNVDDDLASAGDVKSSVGSKLLLNAEYDDCDDDESIFDKSDINRDIPSLNGKPFGCNECNMYFKRKKNLKRHLESHWALRCFNCKHCGMKYNTKHDLEQHIHVHKYEKRHECPKCKKRFSYKSYLKTHMEIHTYDHECDTVNDNQECTCWDMSTDVDKMKPVVVKPENNFQCSVCEKYYKDKKILKKHLKIHTERKNFICGQCKKAFLRAVDLRRHEIVHTKEKTFGCALCNKFYNLKSNLIRHALSHENDNVKRFECVTCHKTFKRPHLLRRHNSVHENCCSSVT